MGSVNNHASRSMRTQPRRPQSGFVVEFVFLYLRSCVIGIWKLGIYDGIGVCVLEKCVRGHRVRVETLILLEILLVRVLTRRYRY